MWLGATDKLQEGDFKWLDGTSVNESYINWMDGQPSNDQPDGEQCLSMLVHEDYLQIPGKWNDDKCDSGEKYVCETNFLEKGNFTLMQSRSWTMLNKNAYSDETNEKMWIGLSDLDSLMTFKWSDHLPVQFTRWGNKEPDKHAGDGKDCTYFDRADQAWKLRSCSDPFQSICKKPSKIVPTEDPPEGCNVV